MAKKATLYDRYFSALFALGWRTDPRGLTRKYTIFRKEGNDPIFLGPSGSVRQGRVYAESRPLMDATKRRILEVGEARAAAAS